MNPIKTGIVGLGRLGKIHAENMVKYIRDIDLISVCSLFEEELLFAKEKLGISKLYKEFQEMVDDPEIQAVIIVSPSGLHTQQIEYALKAGKHVFCEKPLGLTMEEIQKIKEVILSHPKQVFTLGFMRRFDESYLYAKDLISQGKIGDISLIRCYGIDPSSGLESFVKFAKTSRSGGLFIDMAIHDIDLVRWFTGKEVKRLWAIGNNKAYPELAEYGDTETGSVLMQLCDETIAILVAGRNSAHGYQVETEIMGTKGMLRIAQEPHKNLVTIFDNRGVVRPCSTHFPERFKQAFISELSDFARCIKEQINPSITVEDGLQATKVALSCTESFKTRKLVEVNS